MNTIKIALLDDNKITRRGLAIEMMNYPDIEIVFESVSGDELISKLKMFKVEIIILNLSLSKLNGIGILNEIRRAGFNTKILIFSNVVDKIEVLKFWEAEINGYMELKGAKTAEIYKAIRDCIDHGAYLNDLSKLLILKKMQQKHENNSKDRFLNTLNENDLKVIKLIELQKSSKEIAFLLNMSVGNVNKIRSRLYVKTDSINIAGVLKFYHDNYPDNK